MPAQTNVFPLPLHWTIATIQEPKSSGAPTGGDPTGPATGPGAAGTTQGTGTPGNTGGSAAGGGFGSDIFMFLMIGVALMLFFSMRRESKTRKAQQAMLSSIKQGDQVVTTAGIHGTVHKLDAGTVTLLLDSAKVTFERASIARIVRDEPAQKGA